MHIKSLISILPTNDFPFNEKVASVDVDLSLNRCNAWKSMDESDFELRDSAWMLK